MSPRPSVVALATLIAIIFVLILHQFSGSSSSYYRDAFTSGHTLKSWLNDEEERYTKFLQDRQQLIRKWGPSETAVNPWVPPAMLFTFLTTMCTYLLIRRLILRCFSFSTPNKFRSKVAPESSTVHFMYVRMLWCTPIMSCSLVNPSLFPGDFFIPAFQCPHRVERIGTLGDGGKWVCGVDRIAKQDKCVIYSFGLSFFLIVFHRWRVNPPSCVISQGSMMSHRLKQRC
jgi:Methyltransferase domain